jgi:molybdate transport system regulatory protein
MASSRRSARPAAKPALKGSIALQTPLGAVLSESRIRLLEAIDRVGSLNRAARGAAVLQGRLGCAGHHEPACAEPLVVRATGGAGGGGTRLTDYARQLVALYRAMESSQQDILNRLPGVPAEGDAPALRTLIRRMSMRTSARNQLACRVQGLTDRAAAWTWPWTWARAMSSWPPSPRPRPGRWRCRPATSSTPWSRPLGAGAAKAPRRQAGRNRLAGTLVALQPGRTHTACTLQLAAAWRWRPPCPTPRQPCDREPGLGRVRHRQRGAGHLPLKPGRGRPRLRTGRGTPTMVRPAQGGRGRSTP